MEEIRPDGLTIPTFEGKINKLDVLDNQTKNELRDMSTFNEEKFNSYNCDEEASNNHTKVGSSSSQSSSTNEEKPINEDVSLLKKETEQLEDHFSTEIRTDNQKIPDQQHADLAKRNTTKNVDLFAIKEPPPELILVSREEWRAIPPRRVSPKPNPTSVVVFTYYTFGNSCSKPHKCERAVRKLQRHHMRGGLPDVPYNFMVGGDGRVYEGRGWFSNPRTLAQLPQLRGHLIEVAFLGDYKVERPSDIMYDAALELVQYGRENFWIKEQFELYENYEGIEIKAVDFST